jgi:hypothetical protein
MELLILVTLWITTLKYLVLSGFVHLHYDEICNLSFQNCFILNMLYIYIYTSLLTTEIMFICSIKLLIESFGFTKTYKSIFLYS